MSELKLTAMVKRYKGEIDDFVARSAGLVSGKVSISHLITTTIFEIRGSKALTESGCVITSRFDHDGHEYDMTSWVRLVSRLCKVEGQWKMLTLEVIYVRDLIVPVPGSPELDWDGIKSWSRKSYRFAAWHLRQRGLVVREDLPGEDDKDSVKELMDAGLAWLSEP